MKLKKKVVAVSIASVLGVASVTVGCEVPEEKPKKDNGVAQGLGSQDASKDVKLGEMSVDSFGSVTIPVTITNPTSKASDYMIEATIYDANGTNVGTATGYVSRVLAKGKAKNELIGVTTGAESSGLTYKLTVVDRTASYQ